MNLAHLALALSTLIYGVFYVAVKILVTEMGPWEMFALRLLLATPLFFLLEKALSNTRPHSRTDLLKLTGIGLLGITLVQVTIAVGLNYTSAFHTGFIVGTAPLLTLLLSVAMRQETLAWYKITGIVVAFTGLVLLLSGGSSGEQPAGSNTLLGDVIVLGNAFSWSLFLVLSRPMLARYPAFSMTSYAFVLSTLVTLPWLFWLLRDFNLSSLSPTAWGWMTFVVLCSTVLTYFLNYYSLSRLTASTVSVYVFFQPLVTAIFAHWLLAEPVSPRMILDGLLILLGVAIATESYRPVWRFFQGKVKV